jgi:hypothetical protein
MSIKKLPAAKAKRHDRLTIMDVEGGFLVYNSPYGSGKKPIVVTDIDELVEYVREWGEDMIDLESEE